MSRFASRVVSQTWQAVDAEADVRRRTAATLAARLSECPGWDLIRCAAGRPGYLRFPVLAAPTARVAAASRRARALGIMGGYPKALCDLEGFTHRCLNAGSSFPGARQLASSLVTFPTHSFVTNRDIDALARWAQSHGR